MAQAAQEQSADFGEQPVINAHQQKQFNRDAIGLVGLIVLVAVLFRLLALQIDMNGQDNVLAFWTNVGTEIIGVVVTIVIVNRFQSQRARDQLAKELLADIKYGTNIDAIRAINRMRVYDDDYG